MRLSYQKKVIFNNLVIKAQRLQFSPQIKKIVKMGINISRPSSKTPTSKHKSNVRLISKEVNDTLKKTDFNSEKSSYFKNLSKTPSSSNFHPKFDYLLKVGNNLPNKDQETTNENKNFTPNVNSNPKQKDYTSLNCNVITNELKCIAEKYNNSIKPTAQNNNQPNYNNNLPTTNTVTQIHGSLNTDVTILNNFSQMNLSNSITSNNFNSILNNSNLSNSTTSDSMTSHSESQMNSNCTNEAISVATLINNQNIPLALTNLSVYFPLYETTKFSSKSLGSIRAYAANTYQGIIRNYNEDRVSIILNIAKPNGFKGVWPKCSFFGIYDGHGGSSCSDFLRDELHSFVIRDSYFPANPAEALRRGFQRAEEEFINRAYSKKKEAVYDKSGSCAVVCLIVDGYCFIANVGDSRAVMSVNSGRSVDILTNDHKPNEETENKRIFLNGGKVYQTQTPTRLVNINPPGGNLSTQVLIGPYRVFPGRLSVSRTFGDVEAKIPKLGGIPGVVIATPEIKVIKLNNQSDFLLLGCDGIFDQLSNKDTVDCVWMTMDSSTKAADLHSQCALACDMVMKSSLVRRTLDNITVLMIAFENFETSYNKLVKPDEYLSPKNSYYLSNAIENKDVGDYYCLTEPVEEVDKSKLNKVKSLSPQNRNNSSKNFNMNASPANNTKSKIVSFEASKKVVISPKIKKNEKRVNIPDCGGTGNKIDKLDKIEKPEKHGRNYFNIFHFNSIYIP
jgi:serine/threonine protein phosphatase PrpC